MAGSGIFVAGAGRLPGNHPGHCMSEYRVQFEVFEGPLDLLLYLIKKEEVDIYQVNLTRAGDRSSSSIMNRCARWTWKSPGNSW